MATEYRPIDVYYDIENRIVVDSISNLKSKKKILPAIYYGERVLLRLHLLTPGSDSYNYYTGLPAEAVFTAYLNDTVLDTSETFTPMCLAVNSDINVEGDWSEASPSAGKLSIRLDANTTAFRDIIDAEGSGIQCLLEISAVPAEQSYISHLYTMQLRALAPVSQQTWTYLTVNTDYNDQPVSTTEINMLTDQTDNIQAGSAVRLKVGDSFYYTTVETITSARITITDAVLTTGDGDLTSLAYENLPSSPPSSVYTKQQVDALLSTLFSKLYSNLDVLTYNIISSIGEINLIPANNSNVRIANGLEIADYLKLQYVETVADLSTGSNIDINIPESVKLHSVLINVEEEIEDSTDSGTVSFSFTGGNTGTIITDAYGTKDNKINKFMDENAASSLTDAVTDIEAIPGGGSFVSGKVRVRAYYWSMDDLPDATVYGSSSGSSS